LVIAADREPPPHQSRGSYEQRNLVYRDTSYRQTVGTFLAKGLYIIASVQDTASQRTVALHNFFVQRMDRVARILSHIKKLYAVRLF
jgi:hypothetical protein